VGWAVAAITLAGLALRCLGLTRVPPGLFVDEAFTGYDALCILHTGRDMWGQALPLYFRSWGGDAVEGLYRYLCAPWVAILGPVPLAVRLPAALVGAATVPLTYLGGRRLLGPWPAVVAAALVAVSPWHLPLSRVGFRAILVPLAAVALVWLASAAAGLNLAAAGPPARPRPGLWPVAAAVAGGGLYTYAVAKLFVPVLVILLAWVFRRELARQWRAALLAVAVLLVLALPAAWQTLLGSGQVRFQQISVFAPRQVERSAQSLRREHPGLPGVERIASSRALTVAWTLGANYASHFGPGFLLSRGDDNLRHSPPGVGQLLWVEGLLLLVGVGTAVRRRAPVDQMLLGWFLLAPLADSLTNDRVPNALRSLAVVPPAQLLAAAGALAVWKALRPGAGRARRRLAVGVVAVLAGGLVLQEGWFQWRYFTSYAGASSPYWNAGYPEGIVLLLKEAPPDAPLLVARPADEDVSRYALNPYVHSLILFYGRIPPERFQADGSLGRIQVVRLPERGPVGPGDLPPGAWALIPAGRAEAGQVIRWIREPGGREILAVLRAPPGA
jgi:4-amino-4-deoxy-L-arabinose transferase-like glycosyltransferase